MSFFTLKPHEQGPRAEINQLTVW